MVSLDDLSPKQLTQAGFALSLIGALSSLTAILSIFNVFGLRAIAWQLLASVAILSILSATYFFQNAGKNLGL